MNKPASIDTVAERLSAVAETHENPKISAQAQRLITRLRSPVRVVFLGFPGMGKLDIVNAIIEGERLPAEAAHVTVEMRYGKKESVEITKSDGSVVQHARALKASDLADAAFAIIERPIPVLRQVSLLNVVADPDAEEQNAAIAWAASRTDIALWCSHRFGPYDREIWSKVPEGVKDHSFLVLTGCDVDKASDIKSRYRDEFVDVYSIDVTNTGQSAEETGVGELADRIAYHAQLGRRADLDGAMLFLKSHETPLPTAKGSVAAKKTPKDAAAKAAPKTANAKASAGKEGAAPAQDTPEFEALPSDLFERGLTLVRETGDTLLSDLRASEAVDTPAMVGQCRETLTQLGDIIADHDDAAQPSMIWLSDTIMEAESLVILLESEKGDDAVTDAVSILLQVRRDLEMRQAA